MSDLGFRMYPEWKLTVYLDTLKSQKADGFDRNKL